MKLLLIYSLISIGVFGIFYLLAGYFIGSWNKWQHKRVKNIVDGLEEDFIFISNKKLALLYSAPLACAGIGFVLLGNIAGLTLGFIIGFSFPIFYKKAARKARIKMFQSQLVDTMMIFASCLRGGVSFIQAMEVISEDMPPPISQEFDLILKENKLGKTLEESLLGLRKRMPLEEVNLLVTSILVARETGGDLPRVINRLVETIRDNLKLKEKVATLTMQGRLQGIIMSLLPIIFTIFIYRQNPHHFDIMFQTQIGKVMMVAAVILQIIGVILIKIIGTYKN